MKVYKYTFFTLIGDKYTEISNTDPYCLLEDLEDLQYLYLEKNGVILHKHQIERIEVEEIEDEKPI